MLLRLAGFVVLQWHIALELTKTQASLWSCYQHRKLALRLHPSFLHRDFVSTFDPNALQQLLNSMVTTWAGCEMSSLSPANQSPADRVSWLQFLRIQLQGSGVSSAHIHSCLAAAVPRAWLHSAHRHVFQNQPVSGVVQYGSRTFASASASNTPRQKAAAGARQAMAATAATEQGQALSPFQSWWKSFQSIPTVPKVLGLVSTVVSSRCVCHCCPAIATSPLCACSVSGASKQWLQVTCHPYSEFSEFVHHTCQRKA